MEDMMERKMEDIMERKMKVRFDQKEADWKQRQNTSMDRMTQHANNQVAIVQENIQDAELMIAKLTTTLTMVTDQMEEANASIQEIDKATTVVADFTDAAEESRIEFTKIAEASNVII
jgi:hypothetical protein